MTKDKVKRIVGITGTVLLYLFIAICLFGVILTITAKKDNDGTATIFGKQMRVVLSASMEKCDETDVSKFKIKDIPVKSMVFVDVVPEDKAEAEKWYSDLKVGDVITFKYVYTRQETITHRIVHIRPKETGGYIIVLKGDNVNSGDYGKGMNSANDALDIADFDLESKSTNELLELKEPGNINYTTLLQVIDTSEDYSPDHIVGKVTGTSFIFGWFISTLKSKLGIVFMVIVPALAIIVFEVIKILRLFGAEKKEKFDTEKQQHLDEIEELKRKLAQLEANEKKDDAPKTEPEAEQTSEAEPDATAEG